ncbi:DNA-binding response regulator [Clostridia bacterium]|nr:DNA-binding response regulator [Clostridia bacterium]
MEKILVVDDDKTICDLLSLYLEREGYAVTCATNGERAIEKCRATKPDLVMLDIMLPGIDGMQVCKEIRAFSVVPIIMLTAKDDTSDKVTGLNYGADDYIIKPFHVDEIVARVRAVLRRTVKKTEKNDKIIEYDKFIIDMQKYEMKLAGKVVVVPPKEIELLFYLSSNPNKVFKRGELLDKIWGFEYFGDTRTIDVHIKRIREKIDGVSTKWSLKTVWGVGYKFELSDD